MWGSRKQSTLEPVDLVPVHLKARYTDLQALEPGKPAAPWRKTVVASVGGLTSIGFGVDSDLLLVTSFDGRGVFDCQTGERVARDDLASFPESIGNCWVEGIGPLSGQQVRTAGVLGGGLATSANGWSLEVLPLSWPREQLLLFPSGKSLWDDRHSLEGVIKLDVDVLRAFGFSPTGHSFAVATSSDVAIYSL